MKALWLVLCLIWPVVTAAQSRDVLASDLTLTVTVEDRTDAPFEREMVLLTIRGVYRRHITREDLVNPDLDGFDWTQLGTDHWTEERIDGRAVKVFTRRMAVYPNRAGALTIGPFTHRLTLLDARDAWFEHEIASNPVPIQVRPAPAQPEGGWWFPVRSLRVSDEWSNAPDQLEAGEGVLRVIRVEALGVTPEMIPPMPELRSPSGMIFAHPDKRLTELSPDGPISIAFWRWTIQPSNDVSAIVEPVSFDYFDTTLRQEQSVTISAQRVAYGDVLGVPVPQRDPAKAAPVSLPGWPMVVVAAVVATLGLGLCLADRRVVGLSALPGLALLDPLAWRLRRAGRAGVAPAVRRAAVAILRRDGATPARLGHLAAFDREVFDPDRPAPDTDRFARAFLKNAAEGAGLTSGRAAAGVRTAGSGPLSEPLADKANPASRDMA